MEKEREKRGGSERKAAREKIVRDGREVGGRQLEQERVGGEGI